MEVFFRIGLSPKAMDLSPTDLIFYGLTISGSMISGLKETQEMLDFCGEHQITSDIELIESSPTNIQSAYERILRGQVKYRFVLNLQDAF